MRRFSRKAAPGRPQPADQAEGKKDVCVKPGKKTATSPAASAGGTQSDTRRSLVNPPEDQHSATSTAKSKSKSFASGWRGANISPHSVPRQSSLPTSTSTSRYSRTSQSYGQEKHYREAEQPRSRSFHWHPRRKLELPNRSLHCPPSIADYRSGYPTLKDDPGQNANYEFYSGKAPFRPKGVLIDVLLENWKGKYDILESRHDYIQWLFPTRDGSRFNYFSQPLQQHEIRVFSECKAVDTTIFVAFVSEFLNGIQAICADPEATARVLRSYVMMLDFYGMKLNECTGDVQRKEGYRERFAVLNTSSHNYMRITRILKCLGELDYEHLKAPFVRFVLHEAIVTGHLENTLTSCMNYWVETIRDETERDSLWLLAQELVKSRNHHK